MTGVSCLIILLLLSSFVGAQAPQPQETPPPPAPPRSVQFPKPTDKTLPNGLRIIVVERAGTPLVAAQLLIKSGGEADPSELSGLSNMTADLLTKGTEQRTAPEIAEAIEALGGALDSGARWDASRVSINVMASKIDSALEILADVVRRPTFKPEEIERLRQQTLDELTVELGEPGSIARYVAARVVFGGAPYGHPLNGTPESISRIKRDDIVKMHLAYYRPDNAILVIGGDIKASEGFLLAQKYFGDWGRAATSLTGSSSIKATIAPTKPRVVVVDKPDAGQAAVLVVRTGIDRKDPDYFQGLVANSVLSGYSGRLNQEIRIKRGLSYGAASALEARRSVGPFVASAQTKNESGPEVASLLMDEVSKLATAPLPDSELNPRKAVVIGNFSRNLEQVNGLVAQVGSLALYGLSFDEINRYITSVESIRSADVQRFAASHLDSKGASIILVGNAKAFLPDLRKHYPDAEVISISELDLNSGTLRKHATSSN